MHTKTWRVETARDRRASVVSVQDTTLWRMNRNSKLKSPGTRLLILAPVLEVIMNISFTGTNKVISRRRGNNK